MIEQLQPVVKELEQQADQFQKKDPVIAAFSVALRAELEDEHTQGMVHDCLESRGYDLASSANVNLLLRVAQKQLIRNDAQNDYPASFTTPERWHEAFGAMFEPLSDLREEFETDVMTRNIQSNVAERYKAFKLLLTLRGERLGDSPRLLDIGCSQNLGLKMLAANHDFEPVRVIPPDTDWRSLHKAGKLERANNPKLQRQVNGLIAGRLCLDSCVGVDLVGLDKHGSDWVRACSFYPSELANPAKVTKFDALVEEEIPSVKFVWANFAEIPIQATPADALEDHGFDVVTFSTVLYQSDPAEQASMLENAKKYVKPDGLIFIQDFARVDPNNKSRLYFYKRWFSEPFRYRTITYDMAAPDKGFQETLLWENGRCERLMFGLGAAGLAT